MGNGSGIGGYCPGPCSSPGLADGREPAPNRGTGESQVSQRGRPALESSRFPPVGSASPKARRVRLPCKRNRPRGKTRRNGRLLRGPPHEEQKRRKKVKEEGQLQAREPRKQRTPTAPPLHLSGGPNQRKLLLRLQPRPGKLLQGTESQNRPPRRPLR